MAVLGFTTFERFFREAGGATVDRDDVKRYQDFVNDLLYDLLVMARATARANARDIIEPRTLPITRDCGTAFMDSERGRRRGGCRQVRSRAWTYSRIDRPAAARPRGVRPDGPGSPATVSRAGPRRG
jgi:hypothetical protein